MHKVPLQLSPYPLMGQIVFELSQGIELSQKYLDLCSWMRIC